ncbi:transmembrane protein 198-like [Xyrichtys novacula]|uniref:Transmembrane protein 198 n=1 Tax=Xyrichtys novacula TaxID=13765 RepID=A0AAV1HF78_XYRNO|nr:transmembrane protein 198-like [Xyrichtys novacula]
MAASSFNATEEPDTGLTEVDACALEVNIKHEVIPSFVCSICLSLGLIYCFFGYRCFKMVMFFSGFLFSSAAILLFYHKEPVLDAKLGIETKAGIGLGVGVLFGLGTLLVSTLGLIFSGLQLGSLLALPFLVVIGQFHSLSPVWVPLSALLAAGIVTAVLTLQWQKLFTIIYTSVLGATAVMLCVDYMMGTFMLPDQVYDLLCQAAPRQLCWFDWVIAGIWPTMSLIGVFVQWRFTARGVSHRDAADKKKKKHAKRYRYKETRGRPRSYRRRRPPMLNRYAGDVLAPSYLQSLQERQLGTGSSGSSVSTITHTLIDFDYETGSMVPLTSSSPVFNF